MRQRRHWARAAMFALILSGGPDVDGESMNPASGPRAVQPRVAAAIDRFNAAINAHDLDALARTLDDACVFENTAPAPDGTRYEGKAAVLAFWERWFRNNPDGRFETEEVVDAGHRFVVRWVYRKTRDGRPWHLRGIDLFTVRNGLIVEKLAYVKG